MQNITHPPPNEFSLLNAYPFTMDELLGMNHVWNLISVLEQLVETSTIMLNHHNYDAHNYEEIEISVTRGREILKLLQKTE